MAGNHPELNDVLSSAARLQAVVPGAVLVGGTAAAVHAGHRLSIDHDHVVADLADRFDTILDHLEALNDWSTARIAPGRIILGELGGIETGIRQLQRQRPLEVEEIVIDSQVLVVPTAVETLRVKAWLALTRNRTRDYLDAAALGTEVGIPEAGIVLGAIDHYYSDINPGPDRVATQLVRQLADPQPADPTVTTELARYRQLKPAWHSWEHVRSVCRNIAREIVKST